jgi:rubrerythrin
VAFARQAKVDGYPGIAYLFTTLASAELIHGHNFEKILVRLGVEITPPPQHQIQLANTRQNLIKAAADELNC